MIEKPEMADIAPIMELIRDAQAFMGAQGMDQWQNGYPDEALIREDIAAGRALVLMEHGKALCYAVLSFAAEPCYDIKPELWRICGKYAVLHRMAVSGARRGTGLAAELLSNAAQRARAAGMAALRADTHRGNMPMQRFLEKSGFRRCGEVIYDEIKDADPLRIAYELRL